MDMHDWVTPERVIPGLRATSKKQALQELARIAAATVGVHEKAVYEVLLERERLGSTRGGNGVAIPPGADSGAPPPPAKLPAPKPLSGFSARLASPIDFEAVDDQPVDLIFLLL